VASNRLFYREIDGRAGWDRTSNPQLRRRIMMEPVSHWEDAKRERTE
jgi:hypothetical protein